MPKIANYDPFAKVLKVKVVDNAGDPGLDTTAGDAGNKSKYIICEHLEQMVVGTDPENYPAPANIKYCLVERPRELWVTVDANNIRSDSFGNTDQSIGRIAPPYQKGDILFVQSSTAPVDILGKDNPDYGFDNQAPQGEPEAGV